MMKHGQLHNYTMVYIVSAALNLVSLIWVLLRVNEKRDSREFKKRFNSSSANNIEMKTKGRVVNEMQKQFNDNKHIHPLRLLFNFRNVTDMVRTCCKPRANYVRLQIWLLFLTMLCYLMVHMGSGVFLFPFVERVYGWDSEIFSTASAIGNVINALCTLMVAPVLIKVICRSIC